MADDEHQHHCPSCGHGPKSVDALLARLGKLEAAQDEDASDDAWATYFRAVCLEVAKLAELDLDAVTQILDGLIMLDGSARARRVNEVPQTRPTLQLLASEMGATHRGAGS